MNQVASDESVCEKKAHSSIGGDTIYVYIGHILKYLSPLILIPYFSRTLGPAGYGEFLAAIALMTIVGVIVNFGFLYSGVREMAGARSDIERAQILGRQTYARLLLMPVGILVGVIGTVVSPILSANIWYGVLATALGLMYGFAFSWFFQGLRKFRIAIFLEAIVYPVNILLALLLVRTPQDGVRALLALFIAVLCSMVVSVAVVRKHVSVIVGGFREGLLEIRNSAVFFATSMSATLLTVGSTYVLGVMATSEQVGYYGSAEKLIIVAVGLVNPIAQVFMPVITSLHKEKSPKTFGLIKKGIMIEVAYGLACPLFGLLFSSLIIRIILGSGFDKSVFIFKTLLFVIPFSSLTHALNFYVLIPLRKERYYLVVMLTNLTINILLIVILVPRMNAIGMAYARVGAEAVAMLFLLCLLWNKKLTTQLRY